jgi:predicted RNase H-like HicB family nuclease
MKKYSKKLDAVKKILHHYRVELIPDKEDGGFVALIPDLPGCLSQGETEETALKNIEEAKELWIETTLKDGQEIPLPREIYSGNVRIRIPKSLHKRLSLEAEREGVSLNNEILTALERGLAFKCR